MEGQDFTRRMQTLIDEQLVEIVDFGEADGYLPEAVAAARTELAARNLSAAAMSATVHSVETRRKRDAQLAIQPLSWPARIAFFILPFGTWSIMLFVFAAWSLQVNGYKRKSADAWRWMGLGVLFWIGLIALVLLLSW